MKKISKNTIIGQQGINLIQTRVSDMGYIFYPTGGIEAGTDGWIEIRDNQTGEMKNLVLQVQSKATENKWTAETPESFHYSCDERDIDYWLKGNVPVLLIVSRPQSNEAYWISIKEYFADKLRREKRLVIFDKKKNVFSTEIKTEIAKIAIPKDSGIYFSPEPTSETLVSNLLPLIKFPNSVFVAETEFKSTKELWDTIKDSNANVNSAFILSNKMLISFNDLKIYPWKELCLSETVEEYEASEWAFAEDSDKKKEFVYLLNQAFKRFLEPKHVRYDKDETNYYFIATHDLRERSIAYKSFSQNASRMVFQGYKNKRDASKISYFRHSAFQGHFIRIENQWYLQINPTYRFTRDGYKVSRYASDNLKGIKKLERNDAVVGQLLMWADYFQPKQDFFASSNQFLEFGPLDQAEVEYSINEDEWFRLEDEDPLPQIGFGDLPLFKK